MFWTGALLALMPVAIGLIILGVVLRARRQRNRVEKPGEQPPP